jgi:proline iminopeptidase
MITDVRSALYQELYVKTCRADLFCRAMGEGEPFVVVHGGPGLSMAYLSDLESLAKNHTIIFYDQRSGGRSSGEINSKTMRLSQFIEDLEAVQRHFNYPKIGLIGHSWGAYLAMDYTSRFPQRISKLIVLNSIPISFAEIIQQDPYEAMIADIIASEAFKNDNADGMVKFYKDTFQHFFYDTRLVNRLNLDEMTADQVKNSALIHKRFEDNFFHQPHDLRQDLTNIRNIPTLIVHGNGHDIPITVAQEIHSRIVGSTLAILECGHFPFTEKTEQFFEVLGKFLNCRA